MVSTPWHVFVRRIRQHISFSSNNHTGRIPTDTSKESRIYPLPHTYVVKDLVPDMTQFYKQYKSIKPFLQRDTKSPDVSYFPSLVLASPTLYNADYLFSIRARNSVSHQLNERSSTVFTNVSCARAAQHPAHPTGGTVTNISALPFSSSLTVGSQIHVTSALPSERKPWTTA